MADVHHAAEDGQSPVDWEVAAKSLCDAMMAPAEAALRRVADNLYEGLLSDVQSYLRDNAAFNLSSELSRAKQEATEAREALSRVAEALGIARVGFLCSPGVNAVADEAVSAIAKLKARADGAADLLAALKRIVGHNGYEIPIALINLAEAAIAKAEAK